MLDVFSSSIAFSEQDVRDKVVFVIDVLRACSTIHTALENGANGIIPVAENEDAGRYTRYLDPSSVLLCGEKEGKKVEGYHLGNSPLEYRQDVVKNKTIIFKTSNGTRAITRSTNAKELYTGSFLNLSAMVDKIIEKNLDDVLLVCSGWNSRLSIEDLLCAGAVIHRVYDKKLPDDAADGVKVAFGLYEKFGDDLANLIDSSNHAKRLRELGNGPDVAYCCKMDVYHSLPRFYDGLLTIK